MDKKMLSGLTVVVPAYNEQETLESVIDAVKTKLPSLAREYEIIIVNDGSTDGTRQLVEKLTSGSEIIKAIHHPFNIGYGGAQKSGILSAKYDYLTIIPSDGQFQIDDLFEFAEWADGFEIIIGCRKYRHGDPLFRKIKTMVFRVVMYVLFGITLKDINWVKLFKKEVFKDMQITSKGICVDAEVVFKAQRKGCRFKEVIVGYLPRKAGIPKGDLPLNVLITVIELLILRFSSWKNRKKEKTSY